MEAAFEVFKAFAFGSAGFGLRWTLSAASARASGIRDCLEVIDTLATDAERSIHEILALSPNPALSATVSAARSGLGVKITRACIGLRDYQRVNDAFGLFAASLLPATVGEPTPPTLEDIEVIRRRQQSLRTTVRSAVEREWYWKIFQHPIG